MVDDRLQVERDLRDQLGAIAASDRAEIVFRETSPPERRVNFWSMVDGEHILLPESIARRIIGRRLPDGRYMFTQRQEEAPEYRRGAVKCFLHPEASERAILEEMGMAGKSCPAGSLASSFAKRQHARHRHKDEWAALQEHLADAEQRAANERQDRQMAAMLALAQSRAADGGAPAAFSVPVYHCEEPGCTRFFDSEDARLAHARRH